MSTAKSPINPSSWMQQYKELLESKLISEIVLPGTHNSAAYSLSSEIQPEFVLTGCYCFRWVLRALAKWERFVGYVRSWSYCQKLNIWEQLNNGVRYLDLRVTRNRLSWHIHHALLGVKLELVLGDVSKFLEINSQEIVLITIKCVADLMEPLKAFVGTQLLCIEYEKVRDCTVREMIETNRRAIICWQGSPGYLNMKGSWPRTHWLKKMKSFNRKRLSERLSKGSDRRQLFKISWTLTFRCSLPFCLWHGRSNLEALSREANHWLPDVVRWTKESSSARKHGFVWSVDYFNKGLNLTEMCLEIMHLPVTNSPINGHHKKRALYRCTRNILNSVYKRKP